MKIMKRDKGGKKEKIGGNRRLFWAKCTHLQVGQMGNFLG